MTRIWLGLQDALILGYLDAKRDWGHARDYVPVMVDASEFGGSNRMRQGPTGVLLPLRIFTTLSDRCKPRVVVRYRQDLSVRQRSRLCLVM